MKRKVVPTKASPLSMGYRKPAFLSGVASLVKNASQARKPKKIMTTWRRCYRFRKYIIRTMELTAIGVWKSIWSVKVILFTVILTVHKYMNTELGLRPGCPSKKAGIWAWKNPHKVFDNKLKPKFHSRWNQSKMVHGFHLFVPLQIMKYAITALL